MNGSPVSPVLLELLRRRSLPILGERAETPLFFVVLKTDPAVNPFRQGRRDAAIGTAAALRAVAAGLRTTIES
jgi:hypothetical protein